MYRKDGLLIVPAEYRAKYLTKLNIEKHDDMKYLLTCGHCREEFTHTETVEVFERSEDSGIGVHTTVTPLGNIIDGDMTANPSDRRHGIRIWYWCELCAQVSVLEIFQHKGQTFITHRITEQEVSDEKANFKLIGAYDND